MVTPEGKTKSRLREILKGYGEELWAFWPVPSGYGRRTVDVIGCYRGRFFAVETKAEKKKPTLLQAEELQLVGKAMGKSFWMAGPQDPAFDDLTAWLDELQRTVPYDPYLTPDPVRRRPI